MTTFFSIVAIAEYIFFLLRDIRSSKGNRSARFALRMLSVICGAVMILSEMLVFRPLDRQELSLDIAVSAAMLVVFPCSSESTALSMEMSSGLAVTGLASMLLFDTRPVGSLAFRSQRFVLTSAVIIVLCFWYFINVAMKKFSGIRAMFRSSAIWQNVEDYSRFIYLMAFLVIGALSICAVSIPCNFGEVLSSASLMLFLALYALLYLRAMTGRTYIINRQIEKKIKDIIKGDLRTSYADKAEDDKKMNNLYRRIVMFMEEKKPYLDPSFDMTDLSDKMFTNKLYLSKTINILSGRNFRQFVNYHRIQYALSLFRQDRHLKVNEVSEMSGFHTPVSFNMAFKVNTGMTPTEWLQEHVSDSGTESSGGRKLQ